MGIRVFIVSVGSFVVAAFVAFWLAGGFATDADAAGSASDPSTTTTAPETVATYFVDPSESVIATTAIVPVELEITDDSVNLDFDVVPLAPGGESAERSRAVEATGFDRFTPDVGPVYGLDWLLTTTDGVEIRTTISNAEVTVARFATESPLTVDDIESIELTRYLVATPLEVGVFLAEGATVEVFPGVSLTVVGRTNLDNQTTFEVSASSSVPIQSRWIHIVGEGPDWEASSRSNQGGGNWTIVWNGTDFADELPVRAVGTAWLEQGEPVSINIEAFR